MLETRVKAKSEIEKLVGYFEKNIHQLKAPTFNETQTRNQLIDPFFEALRWDVHNRAMKPLYLQEVVPEGRVKTSVGKEVKEQTVLFEKKETLGKDYKEYASILDYVAEDAYRVSAKEAIKKPDYRFRIKGQTKFFVEAKKPSVDLVKSQDAIFQIKRYGFSGRVPVSILTDFEEFRVFDCTHKPIYEKPKLGIIKNYNLNFKEYLDKFDHLFDTFSREAVEAGSLDALTKNLLQKHTGDFALDKSFLDDLSRWRVELAKDIAKHPKNRRMLNDFTLNESVQRILDRIIFFRVCEDREIEVENTLLSILRMWKDRPGVSLYSLLNQLFQQRRSLYNGLLFSPHGCEEIEVNDKVIVDILENLNYPFSPYHFNEIGVEILGSIYEKFLGKTIHMTAKTVRVDEKIEVRKAGGVYYTPQYIVNYIVDNTLGKLLYELPICHSELGSESKSSHAQMLKQVQHDRKLLLTPKQVAKLKIIDIACGSGSFLLGAFQKLIDYHVEWYKEHPKDIQTINDVPDAYTDVDGNLHISSRKKRDILVNNIYGVDIDRQAVEVTQMSLYLKVLEGESAETLNPQMTLALKEVYLPQLDKNIKCGNSLIGTDFFSQGELFDDEMRRKINPFDWEAEFPFVTPSVPTKNVVTSPPYQGGDTEGVGTKSNSGFDVVIGNPPYLTIGGKEDSFMNRNERDYLLSRFICNEYKPNLFALFFEKGFKLLKESGLISLIVPRTFLDNYYFSRLRLFFKESSKIELLAKLNYEVFEDATTGGSSICVFKQSKPLGMVNLIVVESPSDLIGNPIFTIDQKNILFGENQAFVFQCTEHMALFNKIKKAGVNLETHCSVNNGVNTGNAASVLLFNKSKGKTFRKILEGKDVFRYEINWRKNWINYDPSLKDKIKLKDLDTRQSKIDFALRNVKIFDQHKIIIRQTSDKLIGCLDEKKICL